MILSLTDYRPRPRYDGEAWIAARIEGAPEVPAVRPTPVQPGPWDKDVDDPDPIDPGTPAHPGDWTAIETITFDAPDPDPTNPAARSFTFDAPAGTAWLRVVFIDAEADEDLTDPIAVFPDEGLTTVREVRARIGRELSEIEQEQITLLIKFATASIYGSLSVPKTWRPPVDAADFLGLMCNELTMRAFANPNNLTQQTERIGGYSIMQLYGPRNEALPGLLLSDAEELAIRGVTFGTTTNSVKVRSQADEYADLIWNRMETEYALWYSAVDRTEWK